MSGIPFSTPDEGVEYPRLARLYVIQEHDHHGYRDDDEYTPLRMDETYVVWFAYILGGWKALVSTSRRDGRYYEVTRNAQTGETFVDTYTKNRNSIFHQPLEGETK